MSWPLFIYFRTSVVIALIPRITDAIQPSWALLNFFEILQTCKDSCEEPLASRNEIPSWWQHEETWTLMHCDGYPNSL